MFSVIYARQMGEFKPLIYDQERDYFSQRQLKIPVESQHTTREKFIMLIDIGANLTNPLHLISMGSYSCQRGRVLQMIVTGASRVGSQQASAVAQLHDQLYATQGIHPHHADETSDLTLTELEELAKQPKVVAIGETD